MEYTINDTVLKILAGDITAQDTEAVVNAANSSLMGGGGVDGAIHRAGGPQILEECRKIRRWSYPEGLPPGNAVITPGGHLKAKFVIHTVGPVWHGGGNGEKETLGLCYENSLKVAESKGIRSVAFPSISTGAYGYPLEEACKTALGTVKKFVMEHPKSFDEIRLVMYTKEATEVCNDAAGKIFNDS